MRKTQYIVCSIELISGTIICMKKKKRRELIKNVLRGIVIFGFGGGIIISGLILLWISTFQIPTLDSFEDRKIVESTKIYDRTGEVLLYDVFQDIKRTVIPFEEISPNIKKATLAIEDINFYNHAGIDPKEHAGGR